MNWRQGFPAEAAIPRPGGQGLPEGAGVLDARSTGQGLIHTTIAIVAYPHMAKHDEFQRLRCVPGVQLVWARKPAELVGADWVILPGSKSTAADLTWMRQQGLDAAIAAHANAGLRVLGIGGGLPMLGEALIDLHGVDGNAAGLGLLPLVTLLAAKPTVRGVQVQLPPLRGAWSALHGLPLHVDECLQGQTQLRADMEAGQLQRADEPVPGMVWQSAQGNVWGTYWHGMFENAAMLHALWGAQVPSQEPVLAQAQSALARD